MSISFAILDGQQFVMNVEKPIAEPLTTLLPRFSKELITT